MRKIFLALVIAFLAVSPVRALIVSSASPAPVVSSTVASLPLNAPTLDLEVVVDREQLITSQHGLRLDGNWRPQVAQVLKREAEGAIAQLMAAKGIRVVSSIPDSEFLSPIQRQGSYSWGLDSTKWVNPTQKPTMFLVIGAGVDYTTSQKAYSAGYGGAEGQYRQDGDTFILDGHAEIIFLAGGQVEPMPPVEFKETIHRTTRKDWSVSDQPSGGSLLGKILGKLGGGQDVHISSQESQEASDVEGLMDAARALGQDMRTFFLKVAPGTTPDSVDKPTP